MLENEKSATLQSFSESLVGKYTRTQLRASITVIGGKWYEYKICNICDKCSFYLAILKKISVIFILIAI